MNKYIWIIFGIGVVSYATYRLYQSAKKKNETQNKPVPKIKPEVVDVLGMKDVVGYFKELGLKEGIDKPFIAQEVSIMENLDLSDPNLQGHKIIILGSARGKSDDIMNFKALACKQVGQDVLEVLGDEKLVVLS